MPPAPGPVLARDLRIGDTVDGRTVSGIFVRDEHVPHPTQPHTTLLRSWVEVAFTDPGPRREWLADSEVPNVERAI